jgi:hypothetical protein
MGNVARIEAKSNVCMLLVGKPEGKRPLGKLRCRWVNNIKMDLGEIGWGGVCWIGLARDKDQWRDQTGERGSLMRTAVCAGS